MESLFNAVAGFFRQFIVWVIVEPWEQAIRTRAGKHVKRLQPGFHIRIPVLDTVHKQTARMRTVLIGTQTLTTKDGKTLVVGAALGYCIADIERLYRTLHHPDDTLIQISSTVIADSVLGFTSTEIMPEKLANDVTVKLAGRFAEYGIGEVSLRISDFAYIRAFRLLQDVRWSNGGAMQMEPQK